jgi:hypothetical protein
MGEVKDTAVKETPKLDNGGARFTLEFLDPQKITFRRVPSGALMLDIKDYVAYLDVRVKKAFPVTDPDHYIEIRARDWTYLGMIHSFAALDQANQKLITEELEKSYIIPIITSVIELREEHGSLYVSAETTRGPAAIYVFHPHDDIVHLKDRRLRIKDVLDNVYEMRPWLLDPESQEKISKLI